MLTVLYDQRKSSLLRPGIMSELAKAFDDQRDSVLKGHAGKVVDVSRVNRIPASHRNNAHSTLKTLDQKTKMQNAGPSNTNKIHMPITDSTEGRWLRSTSMKSTKTVKLFSKKGVQQRNFMEKRPSKSERDRKYTK